MKLLETITSVGWHRENTELDFLCEGWKEEIHTGIRWYKLCYPKVSGTIGLAFADVLSHPSTSVYEMKLFLYFSYKFIGIDISWRSGKSSQSLSVHISAVLYHVQDSSRYRYQVRQLIRLSLIGLTIILIESQTIERCLHDFFFFFFIATKINRLFLCNKLSRYGKSRIIQ